MNGLKVDGKLFAQADTAIDDGIGLLNVNVDIPTSFEFYGEVQKILETIDDIYTDANSLKNLVSDAKAMICALDNSFVVAYNANYVSPEQEMQKVVSHSDKFNYFGNYYLTQNTSDKEILAIQEKIRKGKPLTREENKKYTTHKRVSDYTKTQYQHSISLADTDDPILNQSVNGKNKLNFGATKNSVDSFNDKYQKDIWKDGHKKNYKQGKDYSNVIGINFSDRKSGAVVGGKIGDSSNYVSGGLLYGEYNCNVYGGFGQNCIGAGASVGGKVSVAHGEGRASTKYSRDGLTIVGCGAQATVDVLSAQGNASAGAGVYRDMKTGKIHYDVGVNAGLEANLVSASGKVDATIAGTKATLGGSAKIGIGAHANAGIKDGELKISLGAAIGIGLDVDIAIDISGTAEYATKKIGEAVSVVKSWGETT